MCNDLNQPATSNSAPVKCFVTDPLPQIYPDRLNEFKHVFIEPEDYEKRQSETGLRICHNFGYCAHMLKFQIHNLYRGTIENEFISIMDDQFSFLDQPFRDFAHDLDYYSFCNPYKYAALEKICQRLKAIIEDLKRSTVTELLKHNLDQADIYCLIEDYQSIKLYKSEGKESNRDDAIYWSLIFNHKQDIIDLYEAVIWYLTEYKASSAWRDSLCLNIKGF